MRKALLAAATGALLLLASPSATADDAPKRALTRFASSQVQTTSVPLVVAAEQAKGIGPGSHLFMRFASSPRRVAACTANFVWEGGGKLYLGAAGHCFLPEGTVATHGKDADYDPSGTSVEVCIEGCTNGGFSGFIITGKTVKLGPVAYARQTSAKSGGEDIGFDFGIVEIPTTLHGIVRTTMPVFGGPQRNGALETGDIVCHYGNGVGVGEVFPTMGRVGSGLFEDGGAWFAASPAAPGDSGSAVQTCTPALAGDEAVGVLTHLSSLGVAGTTVEQAVAMAKEAGITLTPQIGTLTTTTSPGNGNKPRK